MRVRDVMTTALVTVTPDTPFKEVVERLVRADVSSLPVVDANDELVGLITEADLISKEAYGDRRPRALTLLVDVLSARDDHHWVRKAAGWTAGEVMTRNVTTCGPDDDLPFVARRMLEARVKRMPVVDDGLLVGIVSRHDILKMFDRPDGSIGEDVARVLADEVSLPDACHVKGFVEDGVVTLAGDVRYEWDEAIVVDRVRGVAGIIDVVSHIRSRERNPRPWTEPRMFGDR